MPYLIVNADDYGRTESVSAGIRQAHLNGLVTSTTVMMNLPEVETDLRAALAECPRLGLGVHLVLTADRPVLPLEQLPGLAHLGGGSGFPRLEVLAANLDQLRPPEVEAEWRAQIEKFVALAGRAPTHLDSHHHVSFFTPELFGLMLELARAHGCAIRLPLAREADLDRVLGRLPPEVVKRALQFLPAMLRAAPDVRCPDHFEPRFFGDGADLAGLRALLADLPDGVTELMCHPGRNSAALAAVSSYNRQRAVELEALTAPGLRAELEAAGVTLIAFSQLPSGG